MTFERKILRRIDSPITEIGKYRRTNNEVHKLYSKPNIMSFIRGKWLELAGHAWRSTDIIKDVKVDTIKEKT